MLCFMCCQLNYTFVSIYVVVYHTSVWGMYVVVTKFSHLISSNVGQCCPFANAVCVMCVYLYACILPMSAENASVLVLWCSLCIRIVVCIDAFESLAFSWIILCYFANDFLIEKYLFFFDNVHMYDIAFQKWTLLCHVAHTSLTQYSVFSIILYIPYINIKI